MGTRTHAQVVIRSWNCQFTEEDLAHGVIVVLTRVHQHLSGYLAQLTGYGSTLDKLRARPDNRDDLHPP